MLAHHSKGELPTRWAAPLSSRRTFMGRGSLLWLLGVPIPIIILLALVWH
jgi:hypothetical protein